MDDAELVRTAEAVPGFMPPEEGLALHAVAAEYAPVGPILEIGTYCGTSTIYLATAARDCLGGAHQLSVVHRASCLLSGPVQCGVGSAVQHGWAQRYSMGGLSGTAQGWAQRCSAVSRASACLSTSGRLQKANRTWVRPASRSS